MIIVAAFVLVYALVVLLTLSLCHIAAESDS